MRYIDSGDRDPSQALGTWLQAELTPDVTELRWQSGFFSADGLPPLVPTLQRLARAGQVVHAVIGSNDGHTLASHVDLLARFLGLPRRHANLGVVHYAGAYYHAKTYHLRRDDGTQAAYVGSANLSASGVGALHVEAGLILDTRTGDSPALLNEIAAAVDVWFSGGRSGIEVITGDADIARLASEGVLAPTPPPPPTGGGASGRMGGAPERPRLQPLFPLMAFSDAENTRVPAVPPIAPLGLGVVPVGPQAGYPEYVLFSPGATAPTRGATALSGATLPGGYTGVIIRLTRDSARHWMGGVGTANISIPVTTVGTLRFGTLEHGSHRPRAEFDLEMRYLYAGGEMRATPAVTNVMVYGFTLGDTGHQDVRMVVLRPPALQLDAQIRAAQCTLPAPGDPALLEWPTPARPSFRLTLLERGSSLALQTEALLTSASPQGTTVGQGACWLPPGVSPSW